MSWPVVCYGLLVRWQLRRDARVAGNTGMSSHATARAADTTSGARRLGGPRSGLNRRRMVGLFPGFGDG